MYRVINRFKDMQDNFFVYNAGDEFPRKGLEVSAERISELSSTSNRRKEALIQFVEEKPKRKRKHDAE